jgi:hypothetical protein
MRFGGEKGGQGQLTFADVRSPDSLRKADVVPGQLALTD